MDDTSTTVADAPAPSSTPSPSPSVSTPSPESSPTTDRPSFKDALTVFNEAAKQQGRKVRGNDRDPHAITTHGEPAATVPEGSPAQDPTSPVPVPPPTTPKGAIATADHIKAVENARTKTRAEVEAQFRQQFGDPESLKEVTNWARRAATDRVGFLRDVITEALSDPQLGPQVRSLAGQTLRGSQPAASKEPPAPDFQDGQGNAFYSAKQLAAYGAWLKDQITGELDGRVSPLEQTLQSQQQREQASEQARQQTAWRDRTVAEVKQLPHFTDHEADIKRAFAAMPLSNDASPQECSLALYKAYLSVVGPKRDALAQQKVLADLKTKAGATTLNPASTGAPVGIPKNVAAKTGGTFKDALAWASSQTAGR